MRKILYIYMGMKKKESEIETNERNTYNLNSI